MLRTFASHLRNQWIGTLALFLVLSGGTAYAVTQIDRNSVKSKHIVDGEVKTADLAGDAVTEDKLAGDLRTRIAELENTVASQGTEIDGLESTVASQGTEIDGLESTVATQGTKIGSLESLLSGVSRDGNTLKFTAMNLQLVNGYGRTSNANGLGNLIIGYNEQRELEAQRTGSHYLVIGDQHEWTRYGGILAGFNNTATGVYSSILGGQQNIASNSHSSVSGGRLNTASGTSSSVSGGWANTASGISSSVSGGFANTASGSASSILGGNNRTVTATDACHPTC